MICNPCKVAADIKPGDPNSYLWDMKKRGHTNCVGQSSCTCQHRVGRKNV